METYSRKNNIIFNGIPEVLGETNELCESAVRAFLRNTLKIDGAVVDGIQFILCHRLRAQRYTMVRPIIVRFRDYSDRECVWKNMRVIPKNSNFSLSEDFPKSIVYNRKKLLPVFTKARRILGKRDVSLSKDRLTVSGEHYSVKSLNNLKGVLNVRSFTRREDKDTLVFGGILSEYEPLSNWGNFPVTHQNITYPTLEHGFMHIKCVMNDDATSARSILDSPEPYMAKQIGDKVKIKDIWDNKKSEEVMSGLLQSNFLSGSNLARELLETGNKHLAESGRNHHYACGLSITHKNILDRSSHTGNNRLGELLMDIRKTLRQNL